MLNHIGRLHAQHMPIGPAAPTVARGDWLPDLVAFVAAGDRALTAGSADAIARTVHTVIVLELASLDLVNQTFGPDTGQDVLRCCAERLRTGTHPGDWAAPFSDRAYAVWCPHERDADEARAYGEHLRRRLGRANDLPGVRVAMEVTAAVAVAADDVRGAADLLRRSATALVHARHHVTTKLYHSSMSDELQRRIEIETIVADIVEAGAVELAYQPIVRLDDEQLLGAEALLRATDRSGLLLPPEEVIQVAEQCGQIHELGDLILRTACRAAARWQAKVTDRTVHIAVNVSARQLEDPTLPQRVDSARQAVGLEASSLWLEITESALMSDTERSVTALNELAASGVRLTADDFGTGYSSLAYLNTFPLDALKIDRSFTSALPAGHQEAVITRAVIALAQALGLEVIAEGIETSDQRACLAILGVPYGQGYLWSPAVPADRFEALLLADAAVGSATSGDRHDGLAAPSDLGGPRASASDIGHVDAVIGLLAHEIRTPLAVVRGYASLIESTQDPAEGRRGCAAIERAAIRIDHILEHLTVAGRRESFLHRRPIDVAAAVADLVADFRTTTDIDIRVSQTGGTSPTVEGDDTQISQAISNLIGNALRFSPDGSAVDVVVDADAHWVDIAVSDEGPGVNPADLRSIFRKYGRSGAAGPGSGLGLFLARQIARAHGGDVRVCPRPAAPGATFTIRLPRSMDRSTATRAHASKVTTRPSGQRRCDADLTDQDADRDPAGSSGPG